MRPRGHIQTDESMIEAQPDIAQITAFKLDAYAYRLTSRRPGRVLVPIRERHLKNIYAQRLAVLPREYLYIVRSPEREYEDEDRKPSELDP